MNHGSGNSAGGERAIVLGLAEWHVSSDRDEVLVCLGLGSCVAVVLHDAVARVGGMAHMVLPDSTAGRSADSGAKFVDLAVPMLIEEMGAAGARRMRLVAHLVGGACMLTSWQQQGELGQVGPRNMDAAREALARARVRIRTDETGGSHGRTARLRIADGGLEVSTAGGARESPRRPAATAPSGRSE